MGNRKAPPALGWLYHPPFVAPWQERKLWSLARWTNGMAFRNFHFSPTGRPVIKITEIKGGISGQTQFTEATYDDAFLIRSGDMLFCWSGQPESSIDVFKWHGPEGWLNQHIFKVEPTDSECHADFLFYLLKYLKPNFIGIARNKQTTGLGHVTRKDIEQIEVAVPPLAEQRAIAQILGTLDDKIELNQRMSDTLETMTRAIFKSWFVDFDPVRAKLALSSAEGAEGRDPGLPPQIADLFPDRFVQSELGEIPAGWEVRSISDVAKCVKGTSYRSVDLQPSATSLVTLKSFHRGGGYREVGLKPYVGEYEAEQVVNPGEIVVACTDVTQAAEVVGRPAIVRTSGFETLVASLDVLIVRPRGGPVSIPYLYGLLQDEAFTAHAYAHTTGTTVLHLAKDAVPSYQFALPSRPVLATFASLATAAFHRIDQLEATARTLAALRDALLPKLISGELRVPLTT